MTTVLVSFLIAFLVALLLTRVSIGLGWRFGLVDRPDSYRKAHSTAIPRLGGPAILIAFWVPVLALRAFPQLTTMSEVLVWNRWDFVGLIIGSVAALSLGLADDAYDLRPRSRLMMQVLIATWMYVCGFKIHVISNPFGGGLPLGIFAYPVTLIWFLGCMNAVNLLDGMDGLAAGAVFFVSMTLLGLSLQFHNLLGMLVMASMGGAILGFLWYNFPPARIFLGNSGSLMLGFMAASLSLVASKKAEAAVALFVPVIAMGLPILDTSLAILRRWYKRMPISAPDREHVHHMLLSMGYSRRRAVLLLYGVCILLAAAALIVTMERNEAVVLVIGILTVLTYASIRIFSRVPLRDALTRMRTNDIRRRRVMDAKIACEEFVTRAGGEATAEGVWSRCSGVWEVLGFDSARVELAGAGGLSLQWRRSVDVVQSGGGVGGDPDLPRWFASDEMGMRLGLEAGGRVVGSLALEKRSGGYPLCLEAPEVVDRVRVELAKALVRFA